MNTYSLPIPCFFFYFYHMYLTVHTSYFLACQVDFPVWPPVLSTVGCKESPGTSLTLPSKWEWALMVAVMAPLMTRHPKIDSPPFLSITLIFVALTLISPLLKPIWRPPLQISSSSPKPSCQVSIPLTLSKSPTVTFTLVSTLKVESAITVTQTHLMQDSWILNLLTLMFSG